MCFFRVIIWKKKRTEKQEGQRSWVFFLPAHAHLMEAMCGNLLLGEKGERALPCKYELIFDLDLPDTTAGKGQPTDGDQKDDQCTSLTYIISIKVGAAFDTTEEDMIK